MTKDDACNVPSYTCTYHHQTGDLDHEYKYDPWGRMVQVKRQGAGTMSIVTRNSYDALGRKMTQRVLASGNINTGGQGDLYYYDGNRVIQQYAWMEVEGGGPGGGGCLPGVACKHRDGDNPALGLQDQLRPEAD